MKPTLKRESCILTKLRFSSVYRPLLRNCIVSIVFFGSLLLLTSCAKVEQGKVVGFGQTMSGYVQSFVNVELSDGSEVRAWLPVDDAIWNEMSRAAKNSQRSDVYIEIKYKKSDEYWEYVKVIEGD